MAEIQSIKRALGVLDYLTMREFSDGGASLQEIADHIGVNSPTAHNIVKTMSGCGYVARHKSLGYTLGPRCRDITRGSAFSEKALLSATVVMHTLSEKIGVSLVLATLAGGRRYPLIRVEGHGVVRVSPSFDERQPFFGVVTGRVLAAFATTAELETILDVNGLPGAKWDGIDTREALDAALESIRREGLAEYHSETASVIAVAVPVLDTQERLLGTLGMYSPGARTTLDRLAVIKDEMKKAAARLCQQA
jgi:IclR family acetate operon transcriptional repressor